MSEDRCLERQIGLLIVRVACRSPERSFERLPAAQVINGLLDLEVEDRRVDRHRVVEGEVDEAVVVDFAIHFGASGSAS